MFSLLKGHLLKEYLFKNLKMGLTILIVHILGYSCSLRREIAPFVSIGGHYGTEYLRNNFRETLNHLGSSAAYRMRGEGDERTGRIPQDLCMRFEEQIFVRQQKGVQYQA